jgi:hypothetical protein
MADNQNTEVKKPTVSEILEAATSHAALMSDRSPEGLEGRKAAAKVISDKLDYQRDFKGAAGVKSLAGFQTVVTKEGDLKLHYAKSEVEMAKTIAAKEQLPEGQKPTSKVRFLAFNMNAAVNRTANTTGKDALHDKDGGVIYFDTKVLQENVKVLSKASQRDAMSSALQDAVDSSRLKFAEMQALRGRAQQQQQQQGMAA